MGALVFRDTRSSAPPPSALLTALDGVSSQGRSVGPGRRQPSIWSGMGGWDWMGWGRAAERGRACQLAAGARFLRPPPLLERAGDGRLPPHSCLIHPPPVPSAIRQGVGATFLGCEQPMRRRVSALVALDAAL